MEKRARKAKASSPGRLPVAAAIASASATSEAAAAKSPRQTVIIAIPFTGADPDRVRMLISRHNSSSTQLTGHDTCRKAGLQLAVGYASIARRCWLTPAAVASDGHNRRFGLPRNTWCA